ncbi:MAG: shikimate kinase [Eubacteriales bacterium]
MIILLFGITNVGKTTAGEVLAEKIGYRFYDLDEETKIYYNTTLEKFVNKNTNQYVRDEKRGVVLDAIIQNKEDNKVIAISPIININVFDKYLLWSNVIAIELQDSAINIFDRLVFSDVNDICYTDNDYKMEHKEHYLKEIQEDIRYYESVYKNVRHKLLIDGKSPEEVADEIIDIHKGKIFETKNRYEKVKLSKNFFRDNSLEEMSVANFLYFSYCMMRNHELNSDINDAASRFLGMEQNEKVESDQEQINQLNQPEDIIKYMRKSKVIMNREYIIDKIMSMEEQVMPYILKRYVTNGQAEFIETATLALASADAKYVEELVGDFDKIKYPIAKSMLCLVLGIKNEVRYSQLLLEQYDMLKNHYSTEGYENGPLLALYLMYNEY